MGVVFEVVEIIQKRIEGENNRRWLEVIEEVRQELKINRILKRNEFK